MKLYQLPVLLIIILVNALNLSGQELMLQGTFVQTCSPVLGEKFIFENQTFKFYSDDLKIFGQGVYTIRNNRITLEYSEHPKYPEYQVKSFKKELIDKKSITVKVYAPGKFKNQIGIRLEVLDKNGINIFSSDGPVTDSIQFLPDQSLHKATLKVKHPLEGEINIPLDLSIHSELMVELLFQNNWEEIAGGTRQRFGIQNLKTSSFLIEKSFVKKSYYCVFVRQDQAMKLLEQLKQQ